MTDRLESGTVVDGRYRIDHLLGSGGMADVYCATDEQLGRTVALKVLYRRFAQDHEFVERFRREASAAAGLQHQHIVSVYDRGEWGGTYYIAMEHLTGRSLKAVIQERAPLPADEAIDLTIQVLRAARFAHKRGIIHRDFKPHNVLVDEEGRATVTDFGIARAGASEMTQTGSIMGTAQYLSPEQAQGHAVSAQSDLYSIGVVLYEMLTGRVPFEGESAVTIALKQVTEAPVPPSALNPAVPPALEAVVLRVLAKDPAARFASADEFIAALEAAGQGIAPPPTASTSIVPPPITSSHAVPAAASYARPAEAYDDDGPGRRWWIFAILAVLIVGALLAALLVSRTKQVTVPVVVGQDQVTAKAELTDAGFSVDTKVRVTDSAPKGQVLAQDPSGGDKADKGSVVTLTIADGPGTVTIPTVDGEQGSEAHKRLAKLGLKVKDKDVASDTAAKGIALRTSPPANTPVKKGSSVTLFISSGAEQVTVPNLTGKSEADARTALAAIGLTATVTQKDDDTADPGTVLSQTPASDQKVDKGTSVALVVARQPSQTSVPNVLGQDGDAAQTTIQDAGFKVAVSTQDTADQTQDGVVLSQNPAGGKAKRGSTVAIVVGRFSATGATGTGGAGTP
jgi:serine/threonine-protein kinase